MKGWNNMYQNWEVLKNKTYDWESYFGRCCFFPRNLGYIDTSRLAQATLPLCCSTFVEAPPLWSDWHMSLSPPQETGSPWAPYQGRRPDSSQCEGTFWSTPSLTLKLHRHPRPGMLGRSPFWSWDPPLAPQCWVWECDLQGPFVWNSHQLRWCQSWRTDAL